MCCTTRSRTALDSMIMNTATDTVALIHLDETLDMMLDDCSININGAGNCEVNVAKNLDIRVSGVGNVYYMGNPSITQDISGVGNVIPLGN